MKPIYSLQRLLLIALVCVCVIALVLVREFSLPGAPEVRAESFVLEDVTVINPTLSRERVALLQVEHGKIRSLQASNNASNKGGEAEDRGVNQTVLSEYRDSYILPGLVNMHAHNPADNALQLTPLFTLLSIAHGVTTYRDAADTDGTAVPALRKQLAEGKWPMPNVYSCGAVVTTGKTRWPNSIVLHSSEDAADAVAQLRSQGHSCVKSYENLTTEMVKALKSAALKARMQLIGHVPHELSYEQASLQDTQHFFGVPKGADASSVITRNGDWRSVDEDRLNAIVEHSVANNLINTPTLVTLKKLQHYRNYDEALENPEFQLLPPFYPELAWHPQKGIPVYRDLPIETLVSAEDALEKKQRLLKRLHEQGLAINLGTDTQQPFVVPGVAYWSEMALFHQAGIPLEDVWAHATWRAAQQFESANFGLVQQSMQADFLIFGEDPTESLDALASLQAVVVRGKLYEKRELDRVIATMQDHYNSWLLRPLSFFFAQKTMEKIARKFTH